MFDDATRQRFWAKVRRGPECWEWTAVRSPQGYGRFNVSGKKWRANRFSYAAFVGPIPEGLDVLHRCDNPPCVNPAHLWVGTDTDNARDREAKGRGARDTQAASEVKRSRTHCSNGHPYDETNTRMYRGARRCRVCDREQTRSRRKG